MLILKRLIKYGFIFGLLIGLVHLVHAISLDRITEFRRAAIYSPAWPQELCGYRIAFIADTHVISDRRLFAIVDRLNNWQPDLVLLGGDMMVGRGTGGPYRHTLGVLAGINAADGIFGVDGNHDHAGRLFAGMEYFGIIPLDNEGRLIRPGFYLAGVADLWNRRPDVAAAIADAPPDSFVLVLSHNPDVAMRQDMSGVDLMLAGHTHGGQINFLGLWAPYFTFTRHLTAYGQRFVSGWARGLGDVPVYVTRGAGSYMPRVFARPQAVLLTMHHGNDIYLADSPGLFGEGAGVVIGFVIIWNILVFAIYSSDKRRAIQGRRRISEGDLLACAAIFGGIGALIATQTLRHKTRHKIFRAIVPVAAILTAAAIIWLLHQYGII
ncbi:MAG: DUF1294 domain-containing protein [Defluviitaleaceae bacterium]|nr:DUF1294 domain-containing protein [Defluviitaleaceae bacterium]